MDAFNGLLESKKIFENEGTFSVGYHQDGNIMYNIGGKNFKPISHIPIAKLKSPKLFLRISGFSLDNLIAVKNENTNATTVNLNNFSSTSFINCDIYISTGKSQLDFIINNNNKKVFRNSQSVSLDDEDQNVSLHFHFYRSNHGGAFVVLIKKGFFAKIYRTCLYFKYKLLKNFKTAQIPSKW